MKNSAVLVLILALSPILTQSASSYDLSSLEGQAIQESKNVGTGLGAILGAGAGIALARNGSDSQKIAAAIAGAAIGSQIGKGAGRKAGEKRVAKTRQSFVDRSRAEARLRSARQFNSSLISYNQSLRNKITQLKSSKSKLGAKTAIAQAKRKQSEATKQAVTLQNYAKTLPAAEANQVRAAASEIQQSAVVTSSLLSEVTKVEAGIY
jgi:hypothetical protein